MTEQNKEGLRTVRRALLSVYEKTGIVEFAAALRRFNVEIISTGGTAKVLREAGIEVRDVSDVTGFPEMMDGRVKTLHPRIHGGLLGIRDDEYHLEEMQLHGIEPIDMVVVNLYAFESASADASLAHEDIIEEIDIGGPAMLRSAAKNYRDVAVVISSNLYGPILSELGQHQGALTLDTRSQLARLAFLRTAMYDTTIFSYFSEYISESGAGLWALYPPMTELLNAMKTYTDLLQEAFDSSPLADDKGNPRDEVIEEFESEAELTLKKISDLRYGENPHQSAALYKIAGHLRGGVARAEQLSGKEMSFNNYVDADAAWQLVCDFDESACAIIKHTNPAGVGMGATPAEAYRRALATDPVSAFGGIVAFNRTVDAEAARAVTEIFTEVVIAPDYEEAAIKVFNLKKNLRVLRAGEAQRTEGLDYKQIAGGMLVQTRDTHRLTRDALKVVTERAPTDDEIRALLFAWIVCKHTKSNAIVYAREGQTVGVGAGQMSRVDSVKLGAMRAQLPVKGSVLASDAFFPFRDGIDEAARHGITAIIQPGGSVRDDETIAAANEHGIAMVFTDVRHFKH